LQEVIQGVHPHRKCLNYSPFSPVLVCEWWQNKRGTTFCVLDNTDISAKVFLKPFISETLGLGAHNKK